MSADAVFAALCEAQEADLFASQSRPIEDAAGLAPLPGVYALHHQGRCVYVGKAVSLRQRLTKHGRTIADATLIEPGTVTFQVLRSSLALATGFENFLIARHALPWNGEGFGSNAHGNGRKGQKQSPWNIKYGRLITR